MFPISYFVFTVPYGWWSDVHTLGVQTRPFDECFCRCIFPPLLCVCLFKPGEMGSSLPTVNLGSNRLAHAVCAGQSHTCVVLDSREVACWGYNRYGQASCFCVVFNDDCMSKECSFVLWSRISWEIFKSVWYLLFSILEVNYVFLQLEHVENANHRKNMYVQQTRLG